MKSSYKQYIHMIKGKTIKSAPIYILYAAMQLIFLAN